MQKKRRVVITGMGIVSPLGNDVETYWDNIIAGKSAGCNVTRFDTSAFSCHIAAEVNDFDASSLIDAKEIRRIDLFAQYAIVAAQSAYKSAKLDTYAHNPSRCGVIIGSGIGGITTLLDGHTALVEKGPRRVSPFLIPMMIPDVAAGLISIRYNFRGPNFSVVSACASSSHSIGTSFDLIRNNRADIILTGGAEAPIIPLSFAGFCSARAITTNNDNPLTASCPFDKDRDGFLIGEGSGILVLEEYHHAKARGAKIYAELVGYGASGDAFHITSPHEEGLGAIESMKMAILDAGIFPSEIDYVNTHGTSTPVGDIAECKAIGQVFGSGKVTPYVNSTKSMIGHLLGAAGAVELITCIQSLIYNEVHPTINIKNLDPDCANVNIITKRTPAYVEYALSNSFGFGGHNATLIVKKWTEQ
jgi:3-oxoacyl-[acyl-carrier-protein] synthase II